jgi:homoserine dehydrogenase
MMAETLAADRVSAIVGILNGTTNSMLGAMAVGASYEDALADAQQRGMAEADPSADVDAHDPAAKLAILSMLGFRQRIEPSQIERIGIRKLERQQLEHAALGGCVIKLIAAATFEGDGVAADVRPRMLARTEPIAAVDGAMNAVALDARYAGHQMLTGAGAGPDAAASAVLADLIRAARDMPASAGALLASLADMPTTAVSPLGEQVPYPAAL